MSFDDRERMREIGELNDPVAEMLRRMIAEFDDEHYDACPSNDDSGPCNCFAGHLLADAKRVLEAAIANSPAVGKSEV